VSRGVRWEARCEGFSLEEDVRKEGRDGLRAKCGFDVWVLNPDGLVVEAFEVEC